MYKIPFVKMHGLGNDFVIIHMDEFPKIDDKKSLIKDICRQHTSVGCDQLILYYKSNNEFVVEIYNQDSSVGKACGNASRCLTRLISDITGLREMIFKINERNIYCSAISDNLFEVNMGQVSFEEDWMPKQEDLWHLAMDYNILPNEIKCVDIGNPHLVIFKEINLQDQNILGTKFQMLDLFKNGVNINFVNIKNNELHLNVWERGVGFTLSCGSGACASFAAAKNLGLILEDQINVCFKLGKLSISCNENNDIVMYGPANYICKGDFFYTM